MTTGTLVLVVALFVLAGFLIGGVVSFWSRSKAAAGVLTVLAALAVAGAVLRLAPSL